MWELGGTTFIASMGISALIFREYALRRINEGARSILVVLLQKVEPRLFCAAGLLVSSRDRRRGT